MLLAGAYGAYERFSEAVFRSEALYEQGPLKPEGSTAVTFADFGMNNPHTAALDTHNDLQVQRRLVLEKAQG